MSFFCSKNESEEMSHEMAVMSLAKPVPSDACLFQLQWHFYKISDAEISKER